MAEVVQITQEVLEDFKRRKLLAGAEAAAIELDPVAGSTVIGALTAPEIEVFHEFIDLEAALDDWGRELMARSADIVGDIIRDVGMTREFIEKLQNANHFKSHAEAEEFFAEVARYEYLKSFFWYSVRTRLQTFARFLAVRAGYKVVETGLKYRNG